MQRPGAARRPRERRAAAGPATAAARARRRPRRRPPAPARRTRRCGAAGRAGQATPAKLPPAGSAPLVRFIELSFPRQGGTSVIEPQTYLYYIQTQVSRPSADVWVPYDEKTEQSLLDDFKRLWATNFLDNLSIEVDDDTFPNGVVGKLIIYNMEERQRVKIVDYVGIEEARAVEDRREAEGRQASRSASTRSSIPRWSGRSKASCAT